MTFQGAVTLPTPFSPPLNPLATGVRLLIDDSAGALQDITIPGGALQNSAGKGWKVNAGGTTWTYVDKTSAPVSGLFKVVVQDKSHTKPGLVLVKAQGKGGAYPIPSAKLPVRVVIAIDLPSAECGQATFPGPKPAPSCKFNKSESTLTCK